MAPGSKAEPNALEKRRAALYNTTGPFTPLITEAFLLVEADPERVSVRYNEQEGLEEATRGFGPKEEWTLRWLLKRLGADGTINATHACLNFRSWLLLKVLAARLPTAVTARHLQQLGFLATLQMTLQWIAQNQDNSGDVKARQILVQHSRESSGSITVQESSDNAAKESRKRKREGTAPGPSGQETVVEIDVLRLYTAICGAIKQLERLTQTDLEGIQGFPTEYMKLALKAPTEVAAKVLGSSVAVVAKLWQVRLDRNLKFDGPIYEDFLLPTLTIWDLRACIDTLNSELCARFFSAECLKPVLHLISLSTSVQEPADSPLHVKNHFSRLLVNYVIAPARLAFLRQGRSKASEEDEGQGLFSDLLDSLVSSKTREPYPDWAAILFEIAIKSSPRDSSKQRSTEAPWLQALFVKISLPAPVDSLGSQSIVYNQVTDDTLKRMLYLCLENKVSLDKAVLEGIILHFSGLSQSNDNFTVNWSLISLLLKLNGNYFVAFLSSKYAAVASHRPPKSSNALENLVPKIMSSGVWDCTGKSNSYHEILNGVVIPLLRAFIQTRDFLGFIGIMQDQLSVWYETKANLESDVSEWSESVWEDDSLLNIVAAAIETSLTSDQILPLLETLMEKVLDSNEDSIDEKLQFQRYASGLVLDCVLDGIRNESFLSLLRKVEWQIRKLAFEFEPPAGELGWRVWPLWIFPTTCRWRLWRLQDTAKSKWFAANGTNALTEIPSAITNSANSLFTERFNFSENHSPAYYSEGLFASQYLLDISRRIAASRSQSRPEMSGTACIVDMGSRASGHGILTSFIGKLGSALHLLSNKAPWPKKGLEEPWNPTWDGQRETVNSFDSYLMACVSQLILMPGCLSIVEPTDTLNILDGLFLCASSQASFQPMPDKPRSSEFSTQLITWPWLWIQIQQSRYAEENSFLAGSLRTIILDYCIAGVTKEKEPALIFNKNAEFALSQILTMNLAMFKREERVKIVATICSNLLDGRIHAKPLLTMVNTLARFMKHPRRNMRVIEDRNYLFELSSSMDRRISEGSDNLLPGTFVPALRKLFAVIFEYMLSISALDQNTSYIKNFYTTLSSMVAAMPVPGPVASALVEVSLYQSIKNLLADFTVLHQELTTEKSSVLPLIERLGWVCDLLRLRSDIDEQLVGLLHSLLDCADRLVLRLEGIENLETSDVDTEHPLHLLRDLLSNTNQRHMSSELLEDKNPGARVGLNPLPITRTELLLFEGSFSRTSSAEKAECLTRAVDKEKQGLGGESSLLVLRRLLGYQYDTDDKVSPLKSALAIAFYTICELMKSPKSTDPKVFILRAHCLDIMLRKNPWAVLQCHIESLLSTITILTSRSGPQIDPTSAQDVFTCLCRLFGTTLAFHRLKLGNRNHLVLPALQGLLRCLFTPYIPSTPPASLQSSTEPTITHPPWLPHTPNPLTETHASAYARLLTTLSDPTVSAVSRRRKNEQATLNDATKRARTIAGQHLQYLVMEWCACRLRGRLGPGMRGVLDPGFWAILDAMGMEVVRTVGAALDRAGRAVFKGVVEDWRRFGRWEGA